MRLSFIRIFLMIVFSFFILNTIVFADDAKKWDDAANLYKAGKFIEAAEVYEGLAAAAQGIEKAVLFFNLGNCHYRANKLSEAILNFERAVALRPWYADARYNLNAAKAKLEYKIEDKRDVFVRFHSLFLQWVRATDLILAGLFALFVLLISSVFWARKAQPGPFFSFPRAEMAVLAVFCLVLFGAKLIYDRVYQEAIVLAKETEVRYGPSLDNQSLMKLGGGLKVFIVDEREDWSRVVTWNGETGWIRNSEIGKVKV